ncbi:hypothetical protein [Alsobacter sp. SYSU BS001988]|jgi:hypothetical protein
MRPHAARLARWTAAGAFAIICGSAWALDEPVTWRDETGCAYLLTPQGGITPKLRRDSLPDCPESAPRPPITSAPIISDDAVRDVQRGVDALRREIERLGDRFRR